MVILQSIGTLKHYSTIQVQGTSSGTLTYIRTKGNNKDKGIKTSYSINTNIQKYNYYE